MPKKKELGYNVMEHDLVPEHVLLSEDDAQKMLDKYKITKDQLPKIRISDPCIKHIARYEGGAVTEGRIIRVVRRSKTAGVHVAYRLIVGG